MSAGRSTTGRRVSNGCPVVGDTVHVVNQGPGTLVEVKTQRDDQHFLVKFSDGSQYVASRQEILVYEAPMRQASEHGPRRLLYLGRAFDDPGRTITTPSAMFSLIATMVGGGVLSLPYAMSQSGLAFGTLALILSGCASGWTIELLVECAQRTGRDTYELVGHAAFGEFGRKGTVNIIFIICWLTMIAYFVLLGDLLQPALEMAIPALRHLGSIEGTRRLVLCGAALVLSPMCFKSNLAALKFLCIGSVGSVLLVSLMVTIRAVESLGHDHNVEVVMPDGRQRQINVPAHYDLFPQEWAQALYVFPMFGVSFLCHFNALSTHQELLRPTRNRIRRVVILTIVFTGLLYAWVGIFGYLYGGRCTCGNILLNFSASDGLMTFGRACLGAVLMLNFPLICQPARNALFRVLNASRFCPVPVPPDAPATGEATDDLRSGLWVNTEEERSSPSANMGSTGTAQLTEPFLAPASSPDSASSSGGARVHVYRAEELRRGSIPGLDAFDVFVPKDETVQQSAAQPTPRVSALLTVVLLSSALLVSCLLRSILVVWSILGSTVAFLVSFILPALFWYRIVGRTSTGRRKWLALALLVLSTLLAIACTVMTILRLDTPPCPATENPHLFDL